MQVELQLLGAIMHGFGSLGFFFDGGHGMSKKHIVCGAILHCLNAWTSIGRPLPDALHVQLDNCAGDNKNHTVLGLCGHLVGLGIFSRVEVPNVMSPLF